MNLETKITIYKFTPQVFTLTPLFPILLYSFNIQGQRNNLRGFMAYA